MLIKRLILRLVWVAELFFFATITAAKISILNFYRKIFSTTIFGRITYLLSALCLMSLLVGISVTMFGCRPVAANYHVTFPTKDHCVPFGIFMFLMELINALLDVAILAMPCFIIPKLQLSPQ